MVLRWLRQGNSPRQHPIFCDHAEDTQRRAEGGDKALQDARTEFEEVYADSTLQDYIEEFPKFLPEELQLGKRLGIGSFGVVYEILGVDSELDLSLHSVDLQLKDKEEQLKRTDSQVFKEETLGYEQEDAKESRRFISRNCLREGTKEARYAVKLLKPEILKNAELLPNASYDFAVETRILANIMHPNIVKLRATAFSGLFQEQYFIVMDRLYQTLDQKILKWAKTNRRLNNPFLSCILDPSGESREKHFDKRILIAFDLSAAIAYLHRHKIVWRDCKPDNIGFDVRGDVKLFDFGLAAELKDCYRSSESELYHLTAMTGSPRYMSPEVAHGEPYNEKCDTYSFALLLWELLALERPYQSFSLKDIEQTVWKEPHIRPDIDDFFWPEEILNLFELAWTHDVSKRLTMDEVKEKLRKESLRAAGGDEARLEHQRRRSTNIFKPFASSPQNRGSSSTMRGSRRSSQARSSANSRSSYGSLPSLHRLMFFSSTVRDIKLDEELHLQGDVNMLHHHGAPLETMLEGSESQSSRIGSSRSLLSGLKDLEQTLPLSPELRKGRQSIGQMLEECPEDTKDTKGSSVDGGEEEDDDGDEN